MGLIGMMGEPIVQMGPMLVLAGLSAGWLADTFMIRRGYGLIVDMGVGVSAGLIGGSLFLALSGLSPGMFGMFVAGFVLAISLILAQRFCWPSASDVRELKARLRLVEVGRSGTASGRLGAVIGGQGQVLLKDLGEYAAGTWAPQAGDKVPVALNP